MTPAIGSPLRTGDGRCASVLIITHDEERCMASCIESVAWSDDIVVLDSFSSDETVSIAKRHANVRVFQRAFDDFSAQRNHGLHCVEFRNEWVLVIDADETCPADLRDEILGAIAGDTEGVDAFRMRRKISFLGAFLAHNSLSNVWLDRLLRPHRVHYTGLLHEKPRYAGRSRALRCSLVHDPFSKGLDHWIQRRNVYSSLAARSELEDLPVFDLADAFSANPVRRRRALNAVYRRLPCRWAIFFLHNLLIKLCFLDGARGIYLALLESYYELMIVVKVKEGLEVRHDELASACGTADLQEPSDGVDAVYHDRVQHEVQTLLRH